MPTKNCESCFMPLAKDPKKSGSDKYCSYCFSNGKLCYEGDDLKFFQKKSYEGMINHGMNKYSAKFFSWMIRFAPRWKNK